MKNDHNQGNFWPALLVDHISGQILQKKDIEFWAEDIQKLRSLLKNDFKLDHHDMVDKNIILNEKKELIIIDFSVDMIDYTGNISELQKAHSILCKFFFDICEKNILKSNFKKRTPTKL